MTRGHERGQAHAFSSIDRRCPPVLKYGPISTLVDSLQIVKAPPSPRIRSVSRAARILVALAAQEGRTVSELAAALDLTLPTCHHLVSTLAVEGLVTKDSRRRYRLGPKIGLLSEAFSKQFTPAEHLVAGLHRLAEETGETAYLSGWRGDEIVVLGSVEGGHAVRVAGLHVGFAGSAHARSSGKLLLALASEGRTDAYLRAHPLARLTRHTIVHDDTLRAELAQIRRQGYALDNEEFREGVACVSAPVVEEAVALAAFTVSAPVERFRSSPERLRNAVLGAARSASAGEDGSGEVRP